VPLHRETLARSAKEDRIQNTGSLETIAQIALGLAGFSGVFVALTQHGKFEVADRFRLQALLFTSMGAMFLALLPYVVFARSWSDQTMWNVLGAAVTTVTATNGAVFGRKAFLLRRDYPSLFTLRSIVLQYTLNLSAFAFSIAVLVGPVRDSLSNYVAALVLLLGQATIVFVRLLFYRRD
jgi:hypothetical protein